jgi:hypothetical protein
MNARPLVRPLVRPIVDSLALARSGTAEPPPPVLVITGNAYPGETLTSTEAGQWFANDVEIAGQTGATYVVALGDIGKVIRCDDSNGKTILGDADAWALIFDLRTAGATVPLAKGLHIDSFVAAEKTASRWTLHRRLYMPIWGVAAANAICWKSRTSGTWVNAPTHGAGFVQGDGSTSYFNNGIAPNAVSGLSTASAYQFGVLLDELPNGAFIGRSRNSISQDWSLYRTASATNIGSGIMTNSVGSGLQQESSTPSGIISGSRVGGTRFIARRGASSRSNLGSVTDSDFGSVPTVNHFFMAANTAGTPTGLSTVRFGSFGFGLGLTDAEDSAFTAALKTTWETLTGLTIPA